MTEGTKAATVVSEVERLLNDLSIGGVRWQVILSEYRPKELGFDLKCVPVIAGA